MDGDFQSGIAWLDDFKFTGNTKEINRKLEVKIVRPVSRGFFKKRIEHVIEWISADDIRVVEEL